MPDLSLETSCDGHVIGIDEAGRGPWGQAGPRPKACEALIVRSNASAAAWLRA